MGWRFERRRGFWIWDCFIGRYWRSRWILWRGNSMVDFVAGNSTDGLLAARDLTMLEDDKHYFPPYEAVPVVRGDALGRFPEMRGALLELAGKINDEEMRRMNFEVDGEHRDIADVAREFLRAKGLE